MRAEQIFLSTDARDSVATESQSRSKGEGSNAEAHDHPRGVRVREQPEQRVTGRGVQSLHLEDGIRRQPGKQRIERAL